MAKDKRSHKEKQREFLLNTLRDEFGITGSKEEIMEQVVERFEFRTKHNLNIDQFGPIGMVEGRRADEVYEERYMGKQSVK